MKKKKKVVKHVWTQEEIVKMLKKSRRWVERAVLALFKLNVRNVPKAGLNRVDKPIGAYYVRWINNGNTLSGTHKNAARKMVLRYAGQLTKIANSQIR